MLRDATDYDVEYSAVFHGYSSQTATEAEEVAPHSCCVVGCGKITDSQPFGWTYTPKDPKHISEYTAKHLCNLHYQRLLTAKKGTPEDKKVEKLWKPLELQEDSSRASRVSYTSPPVCRLTVRITDAKLQGESLVTYERELDASEWRLASRNRQGHARTPTRAIIYAERDVPLRTAKIHSKFRSDLLQQMLSAQRILGNLVLFKCNICKHRFPTFHPSISRLSHSTPCATHP